MPRPMIVALLLATSTFGACSSSAPRQSADGPSTGGRSSDTATGTGTDSDNSTKTSASGGTGTGAGTGKQSNQEPAAGAEDVVVVVAVGAENLDQAEAHRAAIATLLSSATKKLAGRDARLAVIASPTAAISGVTVKLDAAAGDRAQQVNFELSAKDAFVGTLVAGCAADASNVDSSHAAGVIKVCGDDVEIPSHAWTWTVQDLKGKLAPFLRPGAKRTYIFISSSDVVTVPAQRFVDIAKKQNGGKAPRVFAIAPLDGGGGICNEKNLRAKVVEEAVALSSGKARSYCGADWSAAVTELVGQL